MSNLPQSWHECRLEDITQDVIYGYTAKASLTPVGAKMLRITDIQNNKVNWDNVPYCAISTKDKHKYQLKIGDLVFARTGATVGKSFLINGEIPDSVFASYLIRVRCSHHENINYLNYFFRSPNYWSQITEFSVGIGQPNVNGSKLKELIVPLAPLNEQKRIADKLDALLAAVDACRARLDKVPTLIKRFRQSVLAAATSGALTEDWRELKNIELSEWINAQIQDIAVVGTGSTPLRSNDLFYVNGTIPWITSAATSQEIVAKAATYVTEAAVAAHRLKRFEKGTLLIAMYGEGKTRGQVCELGIDATINQACAAIKVDINKAVVKYVKFSLQGNYFQMRAMAEGGNQPNLNLSKVKEFPIQLPSMDEQREIVRRVEAMFAIADKLEANLATARKRVDQLTPSILAQAFRGELVEQDPTDEPASSLLARIAAGSTPAPAKRTIKKAA